MICVSCGKIIDEPAVGNGKRCPYCAAALQNEEQSMTPDYFKFCVQQLLRQAQEEFEAYCSGLNRLYDSLYRSSNIITRLTAPDIVSKDDIHKVYRKKVSAQIDRAVKLIKACPDDNESRRESAQIAYELAHLFLHGKAMVAGAGKWTMIACEHLTEPLMEHITLENMRALHKMFITETPKREALPNEVQLAKQMQARIAQLERG